MYSLEDLMKLILWNSLKFYKNHKILKNFTKIYKHLKDFKLLKDSAKLDNNLPIHTFVHLCTAYRFLKWKLSLGVAVLHVNEGLMDMAMLFRKLQFLNSHVYDTLGHIAFFTSILLFSETEPFKTDGREKNRNTMESNPNCPFTSLWCKMRSLWESKTFP